nr:glycosyltransferase family 2 protein [Desulfobulbaceae bacterium]
MEISIVIVNWNTRQLLLNCLASIYEHMPQMVYEIWVVDNGSTDDSVEKVKNTYPEVHVIENKQNLGFAAANNMAFRQMNGRYALLLNSDTILTHGAIQQLYRFLEENPKVGMACGQLLNEDGTRQNSFANFPSVRAMLTNETLLRLFFPKRFPSKRRDYLKPIPVDSCIGACMLVSKKAMDDVGLFDEDYFFYFEETDWAYRMHRNGWGVYFIPSAKIYHLQGQTAKYSAKTRIMFYRSRYTFYKKWNPHRHKLMVATLFIRLLVDLLLNSLQLLLSLGMNGDCRQKITVYCQLIGWHLRGCPNGGKA